MFENPTVAAKRHEILADQLAEHRRQQARGLALLQLAMLLTFLLYLLFGLHLYLGDATSWAGYFTTWQSATGFLFLLGIVTLMAGFLSWVKHHAYLHFGLYGSIPLVLFTVIGFALFAEFFSSSANQDTKSQLMLGNNAAYQQTLQAPAPLTMAPGVQLDGSLARDIAAASQTLARCEAKLKAGKAKHCDGDRARLTALESAQAGQLQAQTQAGIAATEAQAKANLEALKLNHARQDQLKAESYNPVIVMMAKAIGGLAGTDWTGHVKVAVVLVMLIVAVSFEILHHFLSHAKERADQAVIGLALELARLEGETGPSAPAAEKTVEPVNPPNRPMGFNWQPTPAPAAATGRIETPPPAPVRFKYQQNPVPPAAEHRTPGFIGFWDTSQVAAPAPVPAPAARSTGNREWQQAGIPAPADRALDRASHPKAGTHEHQLAMPLEALSKPSADGPVETLSKPSADGPVETLSKSSADGPVETLSKPSADGPVETLSKPSADGPVETLSKPSADGLTSLYGMWVSAVQAGECKPSVRESWGWIQKRISARETGSRTHDRTRISNLQKAFFAKAMHEGLMTLNPAYRNGGKKYLWRA